MSSTAWIVLWSIVILVVAALAVRELRSGRRRSPHIDRLGHEAAREADRNHVTRGPNGFSQTWM